ncbi:hypothetical protein P3T73_11280 [Kiritimatiellota bacterium B12222]|nr:hypothetical protein P3T73_11280 [Kiritimatiellota bacterium B12222]
MKYSSFGSIAFEVCKTLIYLLFCLVVVLIIYTCSRWITLDHYTSVSKSEVLETISLPSTSDGESRLRFRVNASPDQSLTLDESWSTLLPFSERKQIELLLSTRTPAEQSEFLDNLEQLILSIQEEELPRSDLIQRYHTLKVEKYEHPPEMWGLPARIVLPIQLALCSLLLIFLCLCVVLLKVEKNTR